MAELIRKLTQTQLLAADPQAIELHEPGLVELDRDACPKGIDIVWLAAGRYGYRHDRIRRQIKGALDGIDRGADVACLRSGRRGDVIRRHPLVRGPQLVDMSQRQNNTRHSA